MSTELSETYIFIRSEVRGKRRLDATINPLIREYRQKLESFKIEEQKSDGGRSKIWVQSVDEFVSELLDEGKTFLFSYQLKINIFDPLPHSHNNYAHTLQVKLAKGLEKLYVDNGLTYTQKIYIINTGIKFSGGGRTSGRWPGEQPFGARI